jgi:hypothetical protein
LRFIEDLKMTAACLLLMSSVVGQYPYYPGGGYYPGYGNGYYMRTPLQAYDPTRYARYYSGSGYYSYAPPAIANPEVFTPKQPVGSLPGTTGLVVSVDEKKKLITVQLPANTVAVAYGPQTHFLASDGNFPVIKPGNLINVNQNTITILQRSQQ